MSTGIITPNTQMLQTKPTASNTFFRRALHNRTFMIGIVWIVGLTIAALILPPLLHLDPYSVTPTDRLQGPSTTHWLGTDSFGRDLLARALAGALTSLQVGLLVCTISAVIGTAIGVLAAFNSVLDQILMRVCDGLMAIPGVLLAVSLAAALGPTTTNLVIALTVVYTPGLARVVRSRALAVKSETFVDASRVQGARSTHIMVRHILPNTFSVTAVQATFIFAESVITEAALSFLGAGVPQPTPSWGNMLNEGKNVIMQAPHIVVFTSLFLVVTVLALNLVGDGLRDIVDSRFAQQRKPRLFTRRRAAVAAAATQPVSPRKSTQQ